LRALRASRVFGMDEKRIRTKNTVIYKTEDTAGVLYKIADCTRTGRRPRKFERQIST
jgi:hypothetical protein